MFISHNLVRNRVLQVTENKHKKTNTRVTVQRIDEGGTQQGTERDDDKN